MVRDRRWMVTAVLCGGLPTRNSIVRPPWMRPSRRFVMDVDGIAYAEVIRKLGELEPFNGPALLPKMDER